MNTKDYVIVTAALTTCAILAGVAVTALIDLFSAT
jgi:hypothetical protein